MSDIYYIESNGKTYRIGEDVKSIMTRDGVVHNFPSGGGNLQSKSAVPSTSAQTIRPDSGYSGLSQVQISAIPSNYKDVSGVTATAADILTGKSIVTSSGAVGGSMPNNGSVQVSIATGERYSIPEGYHDGTGYVEAAGDTEFMTGSTTRSITLGGGSNGTFEFTADFGGSTPTMLFPVCHGATYYFSIMTVTSITDTGFSLRLYNISSSSRTASLTIDYVAFF